MINKTLHSITNRASGFVDPSFVTEASFVPMVCRTSNRSDTSDTSDIRHLLGLDIVGDDYHVRAILGAIAAHPKIFAGFEDGVCTWRAQDFVPAAPISPDGTIVAATPGGIRIALRATEVPVPAQVVVDYVAANNAKVTYGKRNTMVPTRTSGGSIYPEWPEWLDIQAGFTPVATWTTGSRFTITARPTRFPYSVLAATLRDNPHVGALLKSQGLIENFHLADDDVERVATVALALGLSNTAVYV